MNKRQRMKRNKEVDKRILYVMGDTDNKAVFPELYYEDRVKICYSHKYKPFKDYKKMPRREYLVGIDIAKNKDFSVRVIRTLVGEEHINVRYELI